MASPSSRRRGEISADPAARPYLRRRLQPLLLVSRQRAGARGDARGVPLSRHPGRHGHGHRQRRPARGLRNHRSRTARGLRGRRAQPARRRDRAAADARRALSRRRRARKARPRISPGARSRSASASPMRWSTGSPTTSRPTPRRRGSRQAPARRHRGPADGRHERRRRPLRRRQDVPAAGGQIGAGDETGGGDPAALHGGREGSARRAQTPAKS